MAYEPTNWKSGDVVTAAKLNKIEQGIAGGGDTVTVSLTYDEETEMSIMDKTWNELRLMLASGQRVIVVNNYGDGEISPIYTAQKQVMTASQSANLDNYYVAVARLEVLGGDSEGVGEMFIEVFSCTSPDGYPSAED